MIYFFAGDDFKNKKANYDALLKSLEKETKDIFFINKNNFDFNQIESFCFNAGLFLNKVIIVFLNILEKEEIKDFILNKLNLINESENIFIFLEDKHVKEITDYFKKARAELNIFELSKEKKELYDNFLLARAFGAKDKLNLWIHFRRAIDLGVSLEELTGILFWKAKDMLLKNNLGKFSVEELINFSTQITYLVPKARKEGLDPEIVLEQFLLEAF